METKTDLFEIKKKKQPDLSERQEDRVTWLL